MSSRRMLPVWSVLVAFGFGLLPAAKAQAQWDNKKKRTSQICTVRPDPAPSGIGIRSTPPPRPAAGHAVSATPPVINPFAGRSFGIGSSVTNGFCGARPFAPRQVFFSAPSACNSTTVFYPSSNLGYASSASFGGCREVNVLPRSTFCPQPTNIYVSPAPCANTPPLYGFRPGSSYYSDRTLTQALIEYKDRQAADREAFEQQQPPPPPAPRSDEDIKQIETALDRGDDEFGRGNYQKAREEYTRALVIAGEDPGVRIAFGMVEFAMGQFTDAARAMRQAATPALDPTAVDLRLVYDRPGEFDRHILALENHIARRPFDSEALFLLGFIKACTNNVRGAQAVFDRYLALRDADPAVRPFIERVRGAR